MHDILADTSSWISDNEPVVLATVIDTWGSSPRGVGAQMAFTPGGKITGSVSGGCVEGAVIESGLQTLKTGDTQLLKFGVADEDAFEVGLACGGNIQVLVRPLDPGLFSQLQSEMVALHSLAYISIVTGPPKTQGRETLITEDGRSFGSLGEGLDKQVASLALEAIKAGQSKISNLETSTGEQVSLFLDVILPPPTLIMIGGVHIAIALASIAKAIGYRTIVIDPRRSFGNQARFPQVDQLYQVWPQDALAELTLTRSTCVALLTHDPKIDDPALKIVLDSPVFYVGALGSRHTHENRRQRLLSDGLTSAQIDRIHGPIGIDLGADTPEEIALSIISEIVAVQHGRNH